MSKKLSFKVIRLPLSSRVVIGNKLLPKIDKIIDFSKYSQIILIVDKNVLYLYTNILKSVFRRINKKVHIFPLVASEKNKSEKEADKVLFDILSINPPVDRQTLVLTLGGGIVGDMAGYVAARLLRGVDSILIPTTLLAMVDSSLGGKTAVNYKYITNLIGLFYLPKVVIMDISCLKSLPILQWKSGLAELIKHGFLDPTLYSFLEKTNIHELKAKSSYLIQALKLSTKYKMSIISQDFEEKTGIRKILNLGHTIGRALEAATSLNHGQAVVLGLKATLILSFKKKLITKYGFREMEKLIHKFSLSIQLKDLNEKIFWQAILYDKKSVKGKPCFVLLKGVGKPVIDCCVEKQLIREVLKEISK
ncbi:3-dehydroquinate synthase family protein [Patescibacteria group bacterium]